MSKTPFVNGKTHGVETWWYESGHKRHEEMWIEGKKHGMHTWWHENGRKRMEVMWRDNGRHGIETVWLENGKKWQEMYYFQGDALARIEWAEDGSVSELSLPEPDLHPQQQTQRNKNHIKR